MMGTKSVSKLASTEEIIEEARNGRMFILVDDEDRENEGDLVIPAQMATADAINFMARFGRGLVCLALSRHRVDALGLELMSRNNGSRYETAFTTSIEAREGVTTGISAADRARTIATAIDPAMGRPDIVSPGHVFPLIAQEGGVLVRAGHTEAAVDVANLAGLNPSGVICEIMNDDGTMARLDDLIAFAAGHNLKIGTIRDLIAFRRRTEKLVERRAELVFESEWGGEWTAITYRNMVNDFDQLALVKGQVKDGEPTLVRMHTMHHFADILGEKSERRYILENSMKAISEAGSGVIVVVNRRGTDMVTRLINMESGRRTGGADNGELRDYGVGAQILTDLKVREMILLTNSNLTMIGLDGYGLSIVGHRPIYGDRPIA
jgi:3,4-dihydroxy 2-butanone 4-phosphate synthase / GTP cyclohydrolase II